MTHLRVLFPLRVTERADYARKSVVLLGLHEGDYMTARAVAGYYGMSPKMLGGVLGDLKAAGILQSRPGWHGGFRLRRAPDTFALSAVVAAATDRDTSQDTDDAGRNTAAPDGRIGSREADLVDRLWRRLDDRVQKTLEALTVGDLVRGALPHGSP